MFEKIKSFTNRYSITALVVYTIILWLSYKSGHETDRFGPFIALVLAPVIIGGFWYWMQSFSSHTTVKCTCGGNVTLLGNQGPCGCQVSKQLSTQTTSEWEPKRTGMYS